MDKITSVPELPELSFDEKHHIYRLDSVSIPSVSAIMAPLSQAKYKGISESTLATAADKGSTVHQAIENYINFEIVDIPEEFEGYFNAFLGWYKKENPEVIASESRTYHKILCYGGTVDLLVYIGGKLTLVDIKTTYELIDMTCGVQLEAYSQALKTHGINIERKMILQLKKDGTYKVREYPVNDSKRWKVFGSLKIVHDYIKSA